MPDPTPSNKDLAGRVWAAIEAGVGADEPESARAHDELIVDVAAGVRDEATLAPDERRVVETSRRSIAELRAEAHGVPFSGDGEGIGLAPDPFSTTKRQKGLRWSMSERLIIGNWAAAACLALVFGSVWLTSGASAPGGDGSLTRGADPVRPLAPHEYSDLLRGVEMELPEESAEQRFERLAELIEERRENPSGSPSAPVAAPGNGNGRWSAIPWPLVVAMAAFGAAALMSPSVIVLVLRRR